MTGCCDAEAPRSRLRRWRAALAALANVCIFAHMLTKAFRNAVADAIASQDSIARGMGVHRNTLVMYLRQRPASAATDFAFSTIAPSTSGASEP